MNLLSVKNLGYTRDNRFLFKNINFELKPSDLLYVCGSNGIGKSTLLRILTGLISPTLGQIKWNIKDSSSKIQYLGHFNGLKTQLTVAENIKVFASLSGVATDPKKLLKKAELAHLSCKKVIELSAGQKRRLALCRLKIKPANIWILDEPSTALDTAGQQWFDDLLSTHLTSGGVIIMATHEAVTGNKLVLDNFAC